MLSNRAYPVVAGVVALAMSVSGCDIQVNDKGVSLDIAEGRVRDEVTRTYTLPQGGRLEVVNAIGSIEAFPASGEQVEIRVQREVRANSDAAARELLEQLEFAEDVTPSRVKVEVRGGGGGGFRRSVRIDYRVSVPPGLDVSLQTQNGAVRVENVEGKFALASTNGGINGRGVSGSIDATTVNGGINVELRSITADSRLQTVNGGIRLDMPRDVSLTVEATTVNGGISTAESLGLQTTIREPRRLRGTLNKGGATLSLQTTNGGIRINGSDGSQPHLTGSQLNSR